MGITRQHNFGQRNKAYFIAKLCFSRSQFKNIDGNKQKLTEMNK